MLFLDPLFGAISHNTEVTRLSAITYDTKIPGKLVTRYSLAVDVA
jgi:hypothetical protein